MTNVWKKQDFEFLDRKHGKKTVTGYVLGNFGIDKRNGLAWKVTHLPSGDALAFLTGVKLAECKAYVEHVQHLNWTAASPEQLAADNGMETREFVDYVRSVKAAVANRLQEA